MTLERLLEGPVVAAARGLLGRRLRTEIGGSPTEVIISEVEAYGGDDDPASHAAGGPTPRNTAMYGPPGTLYVYRSYGIHWCLNVVTGPAGSASAVLVRGGLPVLGEAVMAGRRGRSGHLADGPGKLAQALGVTGAHDGTSVFDGPVRILGEASSEIAMEAGPRVGISRAADRPWRFVLAG